MISHMKGNRQTALLACILVTFTSCTGYETDSGEPSVAGSICNLLGYGLDGMVLEDVDDGGCGECPAGLNCFFGQCMPLECDDGNDRMWDECTLGIEAEFQVNGLYLDNQLYPAVVPAQDGSYLVAWHGDGIDSDGHGIAIRKVDGRGPRGDAEQIVNQFATGNQEHVSLASPGDGLILAVWQSDEQDGWGTGIFGRLLTDTPAAAEDEFQVNVYASDRQSSPAVASNGKGPFVVAWQSWWQDKDDWGVFARLFDATGAAVTGDLQVNTITWGDQTNPAVAMLPEGGFVVVFEDWEGGGWNAVIYGRLYAADGSPAGEPFLVSRAIPGFAEQPAITTLPDGRLLATWAWRPDEDHTLKDIQASLIDPALIPSGEVAAIDLAFPGEQVRPAPAADAGGFAIAWQDNHGLGNSGQEVFAQHFDLAGKVSGEPLSLNIYRPDNQSAPAILMGPGSSLQSAWMSYGQDGAAWGIFARVLEKSTR